MPRSQHSACATGHRSSVRPGHYFSGSSAWRGPQLSGSLRNQAEARLCYQRIANHVSDGIDPPGSHSGASARSKNGCTSAPNATRSAVHRLMSFAHPRRRGPSSGSLLVMDTKATVDRIATVTCSTVAVIWTSLCSAARGIRDNVTRKAGGAVSRTVTCVVAMALRPPGSVTVNVKAWVPIAVVNWTTAVLPTSLPASSFQTKLSASPSGSLDLEPVQCYARAALPHAFQDLVDARVCYRWMVTAFTVMILYPLH